MNMMVNWLMASVYEVVLKMGKKNFQITMEKRTKDMKRLYMKEEND